MSQTATAYLLQQPAKPPISAIKQDRVFVMGYVDEDEDFTDGYVKDFLDFTDRKKTTADTYIRCIRQFAKWALENVADIDHISRDDVKAYRDHLAASGLKASTQSQYLRAVKHLFKWTAAAGLYPNIAENIHGAKVDKHQHHKDALSQKGMDEVPDKIDRTTEQGKRLYAMAMLCTNAGLRVIELHRANVGDLKTEGGELRLYVQRKGHDAAEEAKNLNPETAEAIWDYLDARTEPLNPKSPLFTSTGNRCGRDASGKPTRRIAVTTISTMLKGALVNAGYDSDRLTPHSIRHGYATGLFRSGMSVYEVQRAMGHRDPATTEIYIHDDDKQAIERKASETISNYIHGRAATTILPELEAAIKAMSLDDQKELLEAIKTAKGGE